MHVFTWFVRLTLAAGFIPSGMVKILGERFTALPDYHPMGHYLQALYETGWYYTFIGVMQVLSAILILIPRTTLLGAFIYFPIILNICLLSYSVRFDGSAVTSPLMCLAVMYLFAWEFPRIKPLLPLKENHIKSAPRKELNKSFPWRFASVVIGCIALVIFYYTSVLSPLPRNSYAECLKQKENAENPEEIREFCDCVHVEKRAWKVCLDD